MQTSVPTDPWGIGRVNSSEAPLLESGRVPVPSLPPRPPSHDGDPLTGRQRSVPVSRDPAAPASLSDADAAFTSAFPADPLSPAILAEDGRGAVAILNEARDRAGRMAEGLEQLETAGAGLTRVQKLVGRLRDVAVVALDRGLHPADRAMLQRQVDLVLTEIDTVADETMIDDGLLLKGTVGGAGGTRLAPFRAIGTSMLGIGGLAVRSSDQALAAAGALDVATARLERSAGSLSNATTRFQDELRGLTGPTTTATGQPALGTTTAALNATMLLRSQRAAHPQEAVQTQAGLDVTRVRWLLDPPAR